MTTTSRVSCDVCAPLGFGTHRRHDESAVWYPEFKEWLCEHCLIEKTLAAAVPELDGIYTDVPELAYHADRNSLSSSGARLLLPPSCPAIFHHQQENRPTPKPQYDLGHVVHGMILGVGLEVVAVDADNWKTKKAQDAKKEAHEAGKVPLLVGDVAAAEAMAKAVHNHPVAAALLSSGQPEITGYWHDPVTGVRLRLRIDWLHPGRTRLIAVDVKTTVSADPAKCARSCGDYRYHLQAPWYLDGLAETGAGEDALFLFVFIEKDPPYLVTVGEIDPADIARGRALNRKAINLYADCQANDRWPGYGDQIHQLSLPSYTRYAEEGQLA